MVLPGLSCASTPGLNHRECVLVTESEDTEELLPYLALALCSLTLPDSFKILLPPTELLQAGKVIRMESEFEYGSRLPDSFRVHD